jgi:hypothetical protein
MIGRHVASIYITDLAVLFLDVICIICGIITPTATAGGRSIKPKMALAGRAGIGRGGRR